MKDTPKGQQRACVYATCQIKIGYFGYHTINKGKKAPISAPIWPISVVTDL